MKNCFTIMLTVVLVLTLFMQPKSAEAALDLGAESAILVDAATGKILYQKNIDAILPTASMTKMMSEYLILEAINKGSITWEQQVPISDHVRALSLKRELSNVPLRQDESYSVKQLYESVAIYSANASTIAIAELIAGSETGFVKMMNDKGKELGLEDYEFVNSTGLNNSDLQGNHPEGTGEIAENMMSARATAKLAYSLLRDYPEVLDTASIPMKDFQAGPGEEVSMENWNWMLSSIRPQHDYEGIDGLKTGYTAEAGNCFTATAKRGGTRLISVVMRTGSRDDRFNETRKLLDYGFNNFSHQELVEAGFIPEGENILPVAAGKEKEVSISSSEALAGVIKNGEEEAYEAVLTIDNSVLNGEGELVAPIEAGKIVGTLSLEYTGEGEEEYLYSQQHISSDVVTDVSVEKAGWFSMTMRAISGFFSGIWTSVANMFGS
ncbi:D-alanyl-D-alanine carboxypeptidase family protein [Bacillus solitudinis]|uniref:D-alanyl-D-alanine carboxypeptidase family protein n=1 Tax=Bacillus solitudinis TaxID=2014074 RepID=UPI000C242B80|nr:D-alanyl-D-alanine carboxypeptidase family protein [Bacillus solitudinis]